MKRWLTVFAISVAFLCLATIAANADESRLALVIGNADYPSAPLRNPTNDARAMSAKLEQLGFKVITVVNGSYKDMVNALNDFSNKLNRYDVGLFYYSGHGVQYQGSNYLVPVDASIQRAADIQFDTLNADQVLADMSSAGNKVNIMILDACRNNPFVSQFRSLDRGLSIVQAPAGSLVVYSTAPNQVAADGNGQNSPFTSALLQNMDSPGQDVQVMLTSVFNQVQRDTGGKQVPWESSSLTNPFYFAQSVAGTGILAIEPALRGVQVLVDGQAVGTTPLQFQASAGVHKVSFRDQRIDGYDVTLTVADGQTVPVAPQLKVRPTISLPTDLPADAAITLNGNPISARGETLYVDPGAYTLGLTAQYVVPVTEKTTLSYGQSFTFRPQLVYQKGDLAFSNVPSYVSIAIDERDITKELRNGDKEGVRVLSAVRAGPHFIDFSGKFVEAQRLSATVAPDTITNIDAGLQLLGEARLAVRSNAKGSNDFHIDLRHTGGQVHSLFERGSGIYSLMLDPGDYQVTAAYSDDPGSGFQGELSITAGSITPLTIPLQYSIDYVIGQLQSIQKSDSSSLLAMQSKRTTLEAQLEAQYASQSAKLQQLQKTRAARTGGGIFLNLLGLAGAALAGVSYFGTTSSIAAYEASSNTTDSEAFASIAQQYHTMFLASSLVGAGLLLWGNGLLLSRPSTAVVEQSIQRLDAQIRALNSVKEMGL